VLCDALPNNVVPNLSWATKVLQHDGTPMVLMALTLYQTVKVCWLIGGARARTGQCIKVAETLTVRPQL
jgi:hypothetical protein